MTETAETYYVELQSFTEKTPEQAAPAFAEVFGISVAEAKDYIAAMPVCITSSVSQGEARKISAALLKIGATIKVRKKEFGELASPMSLRSEGLAHAAARISVEPPSTRSLIEPPSTRGVIGPLSTRSSVEPPSTRISVEPLSTRSSVEPPSTRGVIGSPPSGRVGAATASNLRGVAPTDPCVACKALTVPGQRCARCGWNPTNGTRWCTKCGAATTLRDARLRDAGAIALLVAGLAAGGVTVLLARGALGFGGLGLFVLAALLAGGARTTTVRCPSCGTLPVEERLLEREKQRRQDCRRLLGLGALVLALVPVIGGFAIGPVRMEVELPSGPWTATLPWSCRDVKVATLSLQTPEGELAATTQSASGDLLFQVTRVELPEKATPFTPASLDALVPAYLAQLGGKVTHKNESFGEMSGVEFDFKGSRDGKDLYGHGQLFGVGRVAAVVVYAGSSEASITDLDGVHFVQSFARRR